MAKSPKKTTEKEVAPKVVKSRLTAKDLAYFQNLLLVKRAEILGIMTEIEIAALKRSRLESSGDLSSMPIHMADIGSDNFEQEFAIVLADSERKLIRSIDDALMRIDEGTYGICMATGKAIKKARLEAKPWARYCVEYAREHESEILD